jgi:hypothetical protein
VGLHKILNILVPCSWTLQPPELWELFLLFINHQSMVFCYSRPKGLSHTPPPTFLRSSLPPCFFSFLPHIFPERSSEVCLFWALEQLKFKISESYLKDFLVLKVRLIPKQRVAPFCYLLSTSVCQNFICKLYLWMN